MVRYVSSFSLLWRSSVIATNINQFNLALPIIQFVRRDSTAKINQAGFMGKQIKSSDHSDHPVSNPCGYQLFRMLLLAHFAGLSDLLGFYVGKAIHKKLAARS